MRAFLLFIFAILGAAMLLKPVWGSDQLQNEKWLQERITEAKTIGRGSAQSSFLRLFTADAGDQPSPYRYLLKSCQLMQVEVAFAYLGIADPHQTNEENRGPRVITISPLYLVKPTRPKEFSAQEKWLLPFMNDCYSINPGMSRVALLKTFVPDGGLQAMLPTRYVHKKCNCVKIDVTFDTAGKTKPFKRPVASDEDMAIKTVSRPYVEFPICD
jgi:hypothetical protein